MKMMLHYNLIGSVEVDIPEDKIRDKEYLRALIDNGDVSDEQLISGIESSSAWGIDGDAITLTGVSTLNGEIILDF